jgi:hypothetical protein
MLKLCTRSFGMEGPYRGVSIAPLSAVDVI